MQKIFYEGNPNGFFDPYAFKTGMEDKYKLRRISLTTNGSIPVRQVYALGNGAIVFYTYDKEKLLPVQVLGFGKINGVSNLRSIIEKEKSLYDKISP